jgi:hypothetical protein
VGPGAEPFLLPRSSTYDVPACRPSLEAWIHPLPPGAEKADRLAALERADERLRRFLPSGAILRLQIDPEHWLGYGLSDPLPALTTQHDVLVAEPPATVAARFADVDHLHLSGLLWPEALGELARTAYATREPIGKGQLILFSSPPALRGTTWATSRLLLNALILGPGLGTQWPVPW